MPKMIADAIRKAVLRDYKAGVPVNEIARRHGVAQGSVTNIAKEKGLLRYNLHRKRKGEEP